MASKTLGEYRRLSVVLFGESSGSTKFFDKKIAEQGEDEEVIQAESQMLLLMGKLDRDGSE